MPFNPSRRGLLKGAGALAAWRALSACTSSQPPAPAINWGSGKDDGGSCAPSPDSWDSARQAITSVVVLCMENRSFDHYFGSLSLPSSAGGRAITSIDGLHGGERNVASDGTAFGSRIVEDFTPHNLPHEWAEMHEAYSSGGMNGFVMAAEAKARTETDALQKNVDPSLRVGPDELAAIMAGEAMSYHTSRELPMFYELARQSTLCERWHSSVMGPTWPNRFYLHGSDSKGVQKNTPITSWGWESILDVVHKSGLESKNFYHDFPWLRGGSPSPTREARGIFEDMNSTWDLVRPTGFFARARANTLPALSIIDPHFGLFSAQDANDDHPDSGGGTGHDVRMGQALIASIVAALAENRDQWNRTLLVVTYDESGGFYDHVAPTTTYDSRSDFAQLGFRVPTLLIGPHVRRGCSVGATLEHGSIATSVMQLFETQGFENNEVQRRLDSTSDFLECLDADALEGQPQPPPSLPAVELSVAAWRGRPTSSPHSELRAAAMAMPEDQRKKAADRGILERVLAEGERLGAVRMVR